MIPMEHAASLLFAISFGEFSLSLQAIFRHNFSLYSSVICPDKIRNCLFLIAITSVNIPSRVGKMFVHTYFNCLSCMVTSGITSTLLLSLSPHCLIFLHCTLIIIYTRLLCPWDSPSKNTGVGCYFLLQGIFPTQAGGFFTTSAIWEAR